MSVTGRELFHVASNHSRLFLPEALVLSTEEYGKQKREDDSHEAQEARKWGMSVEEYRKQKDMIRVAKDGNKSLASKSDEYPGKVLFQGDSENQQVLDQVTD